MANTQNLKVFKKNDARTKKITKMGGRVSSPKKTFARIVYCSPKCPLYPCWASGASSQKYGGKCALKQMNQQIQDQTIDLMLGGQKGLTNQLVQTLAEIGPKVKASRNLDDARKYLRDIELVYKTMYGTKTQIEGSLNTTSAVITLEDIQDVYTRMKAEEIEGGPKNQKKDK